jgi:uncharacterized protein YbjT (DUF2867 family)
MKVIVAGGTGFIGSELVNALLKDKENCIWILTRNPQKARLLFPDPRVEIWDINRSWEFLKGEITLIEPDIIVNAVGVLYETKENTYEKAHIEFTQNLVEAAKLAPTLKRLIHISSCGVNRNSHSKYFRTKLKAEEIVVLSGLPYTIFRPSIVMGKGQLLIKRLQSIAKYVPIFVVPKTKVQPVHVKDLIEAIVLSMRSASLKNKICEVGGPEILSMKELFQKTLQKIGVNRAVIELPWYFFIPFLPVLSLLGIMTWEQLQMVRSENICPKNCLKKILGKVRNPFDF